MDSKIKIKCITYNVGDKSAEQVNPEHIFDFLATENNDFCFIGLQEVVNDASWTALIKKTFKHHDYVIFKVRNIWAIWLYGLVKRCHLKYITNVESEVTASGYGGVLGNKGGVSIRLKYRTINFCVVNAHFTAHEESYKDRLNDYLDIISGQSFRDDEVDNLLDHDLVFWMGDLNFRLENLSKQQIEKAVKKEHYEELWSHDQLIRAVNEHSIFKDFKEGPLNFAPTFKYDNNCDVYDTSKKQRKPAWTDRILCLSHVDAPDIAHIQSVALLEYKCIQNDRGSDHRPVTALYLVNFHEQITSAALDDYFHLPIMFKTVDGHWMGDRNEIVQYRVRDVPAQNTSIIKKPTLNAGPGKSTTQNLMAGASNIMSAMTAMNTVNDCSSDASNRKEAAENTVATIDQYDIPQFKPDNWDWIALVPANWVILNDDLITYNYIQNVSQSMTDTNMARAQSNQSEEQQHKSPDSTNSKEAFEEMEFHRKYLVGIKHGQQLQLVYFSRLKNCIQGYSNVFQAT